MARPPARTCSSLWSDGDGESDLGLHAAVGALSNVGHWVGRNTVKRVLRRHGLQPAADAR